MNVFLCHQLTQNMKTDFRQIYEDLKFTFSKKATKINKWKKIIQLDKKSQTMLFHQIVPSPFAALLFS